MALIQKAPGIEDIFPDRIDRWNFIIDTAKRHFNFYNFKEVVIPVMEFTEVFSRGIGDETDIVSKEMFTFEDRGGRSLTLRPEGTASLVRAYCENGEYNRLASSKFFYCGPMFRAEKPQKGRLRQFNQFGAESFGYDDPYSDYEVIAMMNGISKALGITDFELLINSIGCEKCRDNYLKELKSYYEKHKEKLCDDCKKRLDKNTLRLLDCKVESCKELKDSSPKIIDYICEDCTTHHNELKKHLDMGGIKYTEDPFLVRGLDYYCKTTFEFVTTALGGQNAFAAGGRYNKLVEIFGGKPTPAVGFAAGVERIFLMIEKLQVPEKRLEAVIVYSEEVQSEGFRLAAELREAGISTDIDPVAKGFKSQMKRVDREKAKFALIIGEEEVKSGFVSVKKMETGEQEKVSRAELTSFLTNGR